MTAIQESSKSFDHLKYVYVVAAKIENEKIRVLKMGNIETQKVRAFLMERTLQDIQSSSKEDNENDIRINTRIFEHLWMSIMQQAKMNNGNLMIMHSNEKFKADEIEKKINNLPKEKIKEAIIY